MTSETRYAIYFTPPEGSGLERVCSSVLGRSARTGAALAQPEIHGVEPARLAELTAPPRRYGLHATLKAPFFLREGATEAGLLDAVAGLAAGRHAFELPALRLETIGTFLALTPSAPCPTLDDLARGCVMELDLFRRRPSPGELARRRARGLTPAQDRHLLRWGYPYVLDEFRFHLTLTDKIRDPDERERVRAAFASLLAPVLIRPVAFRAVTVFRQPSAAEPFTILAHAALA